MKTGPSIDKRHTVQRLQTLEGDFEEHPDAVLDFKNALWMARGDAELHIPQFLVRCFGMDMHCATEIGVRAINVTDGLAQNGHFYAAGTGAAGEVRNISHGRPDYTAAVRSAKLLLPAAVEAQPLPVNKDIAQLIITPQI